MKRLTEPGTRVSPHFMAAARTPAPTSQPTVTSRDAPTATPGIDARWLAQAIEARRCAIRLLRYDFSSGLGLPEPGDPDSSEQTAEGRRLLADYLIQSERLFELAAALAGKVEPPLSVSVVDNSAWKPIAGQVPKERSEE